MVNFKNALSQLQLVTGIVEKSIKTSLKFGKMSPFEFSFKKSSQLYPDFVDVSIGTLVIHFKILISVINFS
jgi:hypothetical protein